MGFFGDLNKLRIQGEEARENMDVKGTMANAQARMDAMNAAYAAAAPQTPDPESDARRIVTTATVQSAAQTGMVINMSQAIQVDLIVDLPGGIPLPVQTQLLVPMLNLARLQPGGQLTVSIDPQKPASVLVDWSK